jgi:AcrR family transcriptional regulator
MGTVYRHFPTRADLVVAVFRHQLDALAQQPVPRTGGACADLRAWVHQLVDFLVTKHGLAAALQSDQAGFATLHAEFLNRLIPVCDQLLQAAADAGEIRSTVQTYDLLRAVGNLCIGVDSDRRYHARPMIDLLLDGLFRPAPPGRS